MRYVWYLCERLNYKQMDPITIAAIMGGIGLTKAIAGGIQSIKARKELKKEFPKYSRPQEYDKILSLYQREAGRAELPGQSRYEAKISEATSRGVRAASKYADSPVAAVSAAAQLYGQQQSAIRDLGLQYAAFQQQAQSNLANAYQMGAQYSDKEWWQNVGYPDQVKRNIAAQKWNAGQQNLWGGIDIMGAAGLNYLGSKIGAGVQTPTSQTPPVTGGITPGVTSPIDPIAAAWLRNNANMAQGSAMNIYAPGTYGNYFGAQPYTRTFNPWE